MTLGTLVSGVIVYALIGMLSLVIVIVIGSYLDLDQARKQKTFTFKIWLEAIWEDLRDFFLVYYVLGWPIIWCIILAAVGSLVLGWIYDRLRWIYNALVHLH